MKLFIRHFLLFSFILACLFCSINLFQSYYNTEPEHYKKQYQSLTLNVNKKEAPFGIILGSSHATHNIRPSVLDSSGVYFYNYALNGSGPEFILNWYQKFFKKNSQTPQYCLLAVDYFVFDNSWLSRKFEQDSEHFSSDFFFNELVSSRDYKKTDLVVNRFPFLKYRKQITKSLQGKKGSPFCDIKNYDRGYISFSLPYDSIHFKNDLKENISKKQVVVFNLLLEQLLKDNINVVLVATPIYRVDRDTYKHLQSKRIIDSIANKFNIPIINYNTEFYSDFNEDISHYSDWGHMNHTGATVFTKKLAKDLSVFLNNK